MLLPVSNACGLNAAERRVELLLKGVPKSRRAVTAAPTRRLEQR